MLFDYGYQFSDYSPTLELYVYNYSNDCYWACASMKQLRLLSQHQGLLLQSVILP